ncbi:MAG: hypothetical protein R2861_12370 [Desulfobacterales bacterium]
MKSGTLTGIWSRGKPLPEKYRFLLFEDKRETERLKQRCADINQAQSDSCFDYVFVDQKSFFEFRPKNFAALVTRFTEYK